MKESFEMKARQYREMSPDELEGRLEELENSRAIINTRRDIARVKTIMRERK